ncbi:hypothetical protein [Brevundimonas sp. UBA7664]|uniref:hypothetical protein n=1 Tax=Brevundimonas sp. UBA7664 TaxID=1946141 RepID=UPI0025BFEB18|nr:hypothetical protein [Brevundimonas sp. UBA7664]
MTDPNRPTPVGKGAGSEPRDPIADRTGEAAGVERSGAGAEGDPDALDQSEGRGEAEGGPRSRDGAI